jgi:SnoaL-like protein
MTDFEDQVAMRRLADMYCSAVDDGDAEAMAALFVPDGRLVVFAPGTGPGDGEPIGILHGVADFARLMASLKKSYVRWLHVLGGHWVTVDGDRATGDSTLTANHLRDDDTEEVALYRYQDHYVRTAEGWRFRERNACRQWTTVRPVTPATHAVDTGMR